MKTGEVYYWETNKAKGHDTRFKYQLYICEGDWADQRNLFMFISSDGYETDFQITKTECEWLKKAVSYISCSSPVFYYDEELASYTIEYKATLSKDMLKRLLYHVDNSETLEPMNITKIRRALQAVL